LLADRPGTRLADIEPPRYVYLLEVEIEAHGLDHAADAACSHDRADLRIGGSS